MSLFSAGADQPVEDGGCDDCGYDNRCHASLLFDYITGVCLSDRDSCYQNRLHSVRHRCVRSLPLNPTWNWSPACRFVLLLKRRPAEIKLPLFYCESTLRQGRSQRHRAVSALLVGGEKSRLTPPISNYTPKVSTVRTNPSSWLLIPCSWLIA